MMDALSSMALTHGEHQGNAVFTVLGVSVGVPSLPCGAT